MRKILAVLSVVFASSLIVSAQQWELSAFMGAQFFDVDEGQETSPVMGVRWGWSNPSGHGIEVTLERSETRTEIAQLGFDVAFILPPFDVDLSDDQTEQLELLRVAVDYRYLIGSGMVRPYISVGIGLVRGEIDPTELQRFTLAALGVSIDDDDTSLTYGTAVGFLIGEQRTRFRYDLRMVAIDDLFDAGTTTNFQTSGGFTWVF